VGALSVHEIDRWQRYWVEESWGTRRDNLHAAMIVSELLKPHIGEGGKAPALEDFMFKHPDDIADDQAKLLAAQAEVLAHQSKRKERRAARRLARGKKA
jgi:hypothetical protein